MVLPQRICDLTLLGLFRSPSHSLRHLLHHAGHVVHHLRHLAHLVRRHFPFSHHLPHIAHHSRHPAHHLSHLLCFFGFHHAISLRISAIFPCISFILPIIIP